MQTTTTKTPFSKPSRKTNYSTVSFNLDGLTPDLSDCGVLTLSVPTIDAEPLYGVLADIYDIKGADAEHIIRAVADAAIAAMFRDRRRR